MTKKKTEINFHIAECVEPWRYRCLGCKYNYFPECTDGGCMLLQRKKEDIDKELEQKSSLAEIVSDIENELREEKKNDE